MTVLNFIIILCGACFAQIFLREKSQNEFNNLVEMVKQPIQQEGDIKTLTDSLVDYLNGTEAQAVEQYNQNTMNALHQNGE